MTLPHDYARCAGALLLERQQPVPLPTTTTETTND